MAWHKACLLKDLPDASGREVLLGGRVIALFRVDEAVFAVDGMCAHQGGPIAQGQLSGHCVTCPWHGWQYDVRCGENLLTQKKMLDTFATELREGEVWVEVSSN